MKTAILIAPGPSFDPSQLSQYHEVGDCYTVNRALRAYADILLRPKAAFFMDHLTEFQGSERPLIHDPTLLKVVNYNKKTTWKPVENVQYIRITGNRSEQIDPFETPSYKGPLLTTLIGWQFLVKKGYSRIGLVGVDCTNQQQSYFHEWEEPKSLTAKKSIKYDQVRLFFHAWNKHAVAKGATTINLSPKSLLSEFLPTKTVGEMARE